MKSPDYQYLDLRPKEMAKPTPPDVLIIGGQKTEGIPESYLELWANYLRGKGLTVQIAFHTPLPEHLTPPPVAIIDLAARPREREIDEANTRQLTLSGTKVIVIDSAVITNDRLTMAKDRRVFAVLPKEVNQISEALRLIAKMAKILK